MSSADACAACTGPLDVTIDARLPEAADVTASDGGFTPGVPITATAETWSWVDFPDSKCASGAPTGMAVNSHGGAT